MNSNCVIWCRETNKQCSGGRGCDTYRVFPPSPITLKIARMQLMSGDLVMLALEALFTEIETSAALKF